MAKKAMKAAAEAPKKAMKAMKAKKAWKSVEYWIVSIPDRLYFHMLLHSGDLYIESKWLDRQGLNF
jgi:hypothetical protein